MLISNIYNTVLVSVVLNHKLIHVECRYKNINE